MKSNAFVSTPAFDFLWSIGVDPRASGRLLLKYEVNARETLFVADRLWDLDLAGNYCPERRGIYRFVVQRALRLLLGYAPRPTGRLFSQTYHPYSSRIEAGTPYRREIGFDAPVDEYAPLARDVDSPTALESVEQVTLIVEYRLRSQMPSDPPQDGGPGEYSVFDHQRLVSTVETPPIAVRRRLGAMPRPALPGDQRVSG